MKHEVGYDDVELTVSKYPGLGSAAEAHGLLSGMLCVDGGTVFDQWIKDFFVDDAPHISQLELSLLRTVFDTTSKQLDDFDFSFQPFLPDDEFSLEERAIALGEWCQGFLLGIGYAGKRSEWPGECTEILKDFLEIAQLDPEVAGESDEVDYAELEEYVRVGVQVVRSEFTSQTPNRLH